MSYDWYEYIQNNRLQSQTSIKNQISILVSDRDADAEWCQDMNCSTSIGQLICPNTCAQAGNYNLYFYIYTYGFSNEEYCFKRLFILSEIDPNADAEWCNEIDCSTKVAKMVCNDTCKQRGTFCSFEFRLVYVKSSYIIELWFI